MTDIVNMTDRKLLYDFKEPDPRNYIFHADVNETLNLELTTTTIPSTNNVKTSSTPISLSAFTINNLSPIFDQGNLGDCVANAFAYCINVKTQNTVNISRLYTYANCRILQNTSLNQDCGTSILTACKSIKNYGAASESLYPYIISMFSNFPPLSIYQSAKYFKSFTYTFVAQNITSIKNCLNTYNMPIIFGFMVYSSFMTNTVASTGNVPMPNIQTEKLEGGHCINIVGYNDETQMFTCANSWGTSWGNKGYCYIPYNYLLNPKLAFDFCFIQFVY